MKSNFREIVHHSFIIGCKMVLSLQSQKYCMGQYAIGQMECFDKSDIPLMRLVLYYMLKVQQEKQVTLLQGTFGLR